MPSGAGFAAFDRIATQIGSADAGALRALGTQFTELGRRAGLGRDAFTAIAGDVAAIPGRPYATFHGRLSPTARWMGTMSDVTPPVAQQLEASAGKVDEAKAALAAKQAELSGKTFTAPTQAEADAAADAAYMQAAQELQPYVDAVDTSYAAIDPADTGRPPEPRGGTAGTGGVGTGGVAAGARDAGGTQAAGLRSGVEGGNAGAAPGVAATAGAAGEGGLPGTITGSENGAYDGWVRMPNGELVDPATGVAVSSGGQMLDPLTNQAMGAYDTRLAGSVAATPTGGLFGGAGGVAASVGVGGVAAGIGGGGVVGGVGGVAALAGLYGGVVPPSLRSTSPISGQLVRQAKENMSLKAATARNFASLTSGNGLPGQNAHGYAPPMGGMGAGAGAGARTEPKGRGLVREPASAWGGARSKKGTARTPVGQSAAAATVLQSGHVPPMGGAGAVGSAVKPGGRGLVHESGSIWGADGRATRRRDPRESDELDDTPRDGGTLA
jgi:hypothetical protein